MAYNPIPYTALATRLKEIGAEVVPYGVIVGTEEIVFDIPVRSKSGKIYPFIVRIYSSIEHGSFFTRDCGDDAIRVYLIAEHNKYNQVKVLRRSKKVLRTGETDAIIGRIVDRARDMFKIAIDPYYKCPKCHDGLMKVREERKTGKKFRGCSNYPGCRHTDQNVIPEDGE